MAWAGCNAKGDLGIGYEAWLVMAWIVAITTGDIDMFYIAILLSLPLVFMYLTFKLSEYDIEEQNKLLEIKQYRGYPKHLWPERLQKYHDPKDDDF